MKPVCTSIPSLLRTSYMATHTEPLLDEAMDIIRSVLCDGGQN